MSNSLFSPFQSRLFLAVWIATLFSNFGMQIHVMASGWLMLRLDPSPQMVALVQVAASLPFMLFALLAGALSDIYDKRRIMLTAQLFSVVTAGILAILAYLDFVAPWSLLVLVSLIAKGTAFYGPAWASSVSLMVPREHLAEAINLNAINPNLGRSLAPALGGMLIALFGIAWAFIINTLSYLGVMAVLWRWKPAQKEPVKNKEPIIWAIRIGIRYALRSDHIRVVLVRIMLCATGTGIFWSLMPVLAKQHLNGDTATFSVLLSALGVGSVCGGLLVSRLRVLLGIQKSSLLAQLIMAFSGAVAVLTNDLAFCAAAIALLGVAWMVFIPNMYSSIQMSAPDWVVGRMVAIFQSTIYLSFAAGGLLWGWVASEFSLVTAFLAAALVTFLSTLYGIAKPVLGLDEVNSENANLPDITESLRRTDTASSPIVVTIAYHVATEDTQAFFDVMAKLKSVRLRLGAVNWTLQQELNRPEFWVERYITKDWEEQRRRHTRYSHDDNEIRLKAGSFDKNKSPQYVYMVIRDPKHTAFLPDAVPPV